MQNKDFYKEFGIRSRVIFSNGRSPASRRRLIQHRMHTTFDADQMAFVVLRDDGDYASELRGLGTVKVYESGFPVAFFYTGYSDVTNQENALFSVAANASLEILEDLLIDRVISPYMETVDWRAYFDDKLKKPELLLRASLESQRPVLKLPNAQALFKSIFYRLASISLEEGYLDEYVERRRGLEERAIELAEQTLCANPNIADRARSILEKYNCMDPLNPDITTVTHDIDLLINMILVGGYNASVNLPKPPKRITTPEGIDLNIMEVEFFRPPK